MTDTQDLTITVTDLADVVDGTAGVDTIAGGPAGGTYNLLGGNDSFTGSAAVDLVSGGEGEDVIDGAGDSDTLFGDADADTITGGGGNDIIDGGAGADSMTGGTGSDTYYVDDAGDTIAEISSQGYDRVHASVSYALAANVESLTLTGAAALNGDGNNLNNAMAGNEAANILHGANGNDTIDRRGRRRHLVWRRRRGCDHWRRRQRRHQRGHRRRHDDWRDRKRHVLCRQCRRRHR
ncbi:MAG: hypothetical protein WDM79_07250 [Terricaulis sp.]